MIDNSGWYIEQFPYFIIPAPISPRVEQINRVSANDIVQELEVFV